MAERCAICKSTERLVRDHDHATGEVRGWLCSRCNVMLGYADDSSERLTNAVDYLATTSRKPRATLGETTPAKRDRAAYMRDYRAKRTRAAVVANAALDLEVAGERANHEHRFTQEWRYMAPEGTMMFLRCEDCMAVDGPPRRETDTRIAESAASGPRFNSRPFTPVPKK